MIEAMKQMVEAVESDLKLFNIPLTARMVEALSAGRQAIAEAEKQEPVAYAVKTVHGKKWHSIHASKGASDKWLEYRVKEQAHGEQYEQHALYTTPPASQKPLTDEKIEEIEKSFKYGWHHIDFARAIEAAHNIKE